MFTFLPNSVLQMATIFLSIIMEALPFVIFGCIVAGLIQIFLTPERVAKILPKNKFLAVITGSIMGFFFPSCECGIIPIVYQFMQKGVPSYTAISFMLTAPIINPVVIFSTYIAFGNNIRYALLRVLGSLIVALSIGLYLAYRYKGPVLKEKVLAINYAKVPAQAGSDLLTQLKSGQTVRTASPLVDTTALTFRHKVWLALQHATEEVFDTGRYLIIGSLVAAMMQTYLPTSFILQFATSKLLGILIMMLLTFILSLCSEADAFIGASMLGMFGRGPVMAFLVFGPMVDIKNLLLMNRFFDRKFTASLVLMTALIIIVYSIFL